jgi:hypothetical protein
MTEPKSAFPTVGDNVIAHVMGSSSARSSRYTTTVAKKTGGRGASPTGTTGSRSNTKISNANGPKCHIQTTLYKANAAQASATTRNVKIMPNAISRAGFWSKREYGQGA